MANLENSKLIARYITSLSKQEMRKLSSFLKSPYVPVKDLSPFFKIIHKYYPKFSNKNFTEEAVFKALYPERTFRKDGLAKLKGNMISEIENFLILEELKEDKILKKNLVNKCYAKRKDYITFRNASEGTISDIQKTATKTVKNYKDLMDTFHDLYFHPETPKNNALSDTYINGCLENLDCFYFYTRIMYALEIQNRGSLQAEKTEIKFLPETKRLAQQTSLQENPTYNLYVTLSTFLDKKKKKTFKKLKSLLKNNPCISRQDKLVTIILLSNYAFSQFRDGKISYRKKLFALNKIRDQLNLFLVSNIISDEAFINIIINAAACKQFEWLEAFKDKYFEYLKEDTREDTWLLCNAYYAFYQENYDEASSLVSKNFYEGIEKKYLDNVNVKLRIYSLTIRILHERSLKDNSLFCLLEDKIENFKNYLRRTTINENRQIAYLNFSRACTLLLSGKPKEIVIEKINEMKPLLFKVWLLEKAKQL